METTEAVAALAALAHDSRMAVFRLLVRAAPGSVSAGAIAEQLDIPAPTLSFHLAQLKVAGLVGAQRDGRSQLYGLRVERVRELLGFLTDDCCEGRPELCQPGGLPSECCAEEAP